MAEYIKIDKNTFPTFYKRNLTDYGKGWNACLNSVLQHKTADVVEVVRCRDCKICELRYPAKAIGEEAIEGYYCYQIQRYVKPTEFCSYGERRENNAKKQNS